MKYWNCGSVGRVTRRPKMSVFEELGDAKHQFLTSWELDSKTFLQLSSFLEMCTWAVSELVFVFMSITCVGDNSFIIDSK